MAVSSGPLRFFTPTGAAATAFHGGTGLTGPFHSTSPTFRSNVQGEQFSSHGIYVQVECIHIPLHSLLYLMKEIGWDPIKDIKKFDEFYFSKKLAILAELIHRQTKKKKF
jgi:hypothetical protein